MAGQGAGDRQLREEALRHPAVLRAVDHRDPAGARGVLARRRHVGAAAGVRAGGAHDDRARRPSTRSPAPRASTTWSCRSSAPTATRRASPASSRASRTRPPSRSARSIPASLPADGTEVCLTVSHIRPQPGIGYDERRYVNLWGPAHVDGRILSVTVEQASGWDEADVPFFEYAERSVPVAHDYFAEVGGKPAPLACVDVLPRDPPAVPHRDDRPDRARRRGRRATTGSSRWAGGSSPCVAGCLVHLGLNIANDLFDDASRRRRRQHHARRRSAAARGSCSTGS